MLSQTLGSLRLPAPWSCGHLGHWGLGPLSSSGVSRASLDKVDSDRATGAGVFVEPGLASPRATPLLHQHPGDPGSSCPWCGHHLLATSAQDSASPMTALTALVRHLLVLMWTSGSSEARVAEVGSGWAGSGWWVRPTLPTVAARVQGVGFGPQAGWRGWQGAGLCALPWKVPPKPKDAGSPGPEQLWPGGGRGEEWEGGEPAAHRASEGSRPPAQPAASSPSLKGPQCQQLGPSLQNPGVQSA